MASCGVALEPVAVEEVRIDVVAVATGIERRGVGAHFEGIPLVAFEGGFLIGERGIMPGGRSGRIPGLSSLGLPRIRDYVLRVTAMHIAHSFDHEISRTAAPGEPVTPEFRLPTRRWRQ